MAGGGKYVCPLAHSSLRGDLPPDPYPRHVRAVCAGTRDRAQEMLQFAVPPPEGLLDSVCSAATFHDLGKLDPIMQSVLQCGRKAKLEGRHDHIDAGAAHLSAAREWMGAWLVRAHHAPGLPQKSEHFTEKTDRRLRGLRDDKKPIDLHKVQISRTDSCLNEYLDAHFSSVGA